MSRSNETMERINKEEIVLNNQKRVAMLWMIVAFACLTMSAFAQEEVSLQNDVLRARLNTLYGPSGLITVPYAYVASSNRVVIGTTYGKDKSVSGNYGVFRSVEVGVSYVEPESLKGKVFGNAKVHIIPANFKNFDLGIGVIDLGDARKRTFYGIVSADWATPEILEKYAVGLRLHAGAGTGVFREKFIGGAEVLMSDRVSLIVEYNGVDTNAAIRYVRDEGFRMQAGILRKGVFFGTSYALHSKPTRVSGYNLKNR
jgi:hypothetical protein